MLQHAKETKIAIKYLWNSYTKLMGGQRNDHQMQGNRGLKTYWINVKAIRTFDNVDI